MPVFEGTPESETLWGSNENDTLYGRGGADRILGYSGDDTIYGGSRNDRIYAGSGDDMIDGFSAGGEEDSLDFSALGIGYSDLTIVQQGDDTLITTPGGDSVLLLDVLPGQLDAGADFAF